MRGKPAASSKDVATARNIPAYAGKTFDLKTRHHQATEHPRVCGENGISSITRIVTSGTSPRMRGKLAAEMFVAAARRNIPAYAGKTHCRQKRHNQGKEHPRVCGENKVYPCALSRQRGTSPRMRGKRHSLAPNTPNARNIPAYAGKTIIKVQEVC